MMRGIFNLERIYSTLIISSEFNLAEPTGHSPNPNATRDLSLQVQNVSEVKRKKIDIPLEYK